MVDFVGTPPFLRITLQVAILTMHFHIAQAGLFLGIFFRILGIPGHNLAPMKNCPVGVHGRSN